MKLKIVTALLVMLTVSGCAWLDKAKKEGQEALENVQKETAEIEETYQDTKKAIDSVNQAVKDIKEITE